MHVFMAAWWILGPHSEQLGVTNQNDLIESHVQTSWDSDNSDDNVCVCVCMDVNVQYAFIMVNANIYHICQYGTYWYTKKLQYSL